MTLPFSFQFTAPDGSSPTAVDLNPDVVGVTFSTADPGGYDTLNVGIRSSERDVYAWSPEPLAVRGGWTVKVRRGGVVWEGRVTEVQQLGRGFTAKGFGFAAMSDNWYGGGSNVVTMTCDQIVRDVVRRATTLVVPGVSQSFVGSDTQHAPSEFAYRTPSQVFDQLALEGGGPQQVPWSFVVWTNLTVRFFPRIAPTTPDYVLPFNPDVMIVSENWEQVWSEATIVYSDVNGDSRTFTQLNPAAKRLLGFDRKAVINGPTGVSSGGAITFLQTWLREHAAPTWSVSLVVPNGRGLPTSFGGAEDPPERVRAARWAQVVGVAPLLPLTTTSYDATGGTLSVQLGPPSLRTLGARLQRLAQTDAAVRQGVHPVTRGPGLGPASSLRSNPTTSRYG